MKIAFYAPLKSPDHPVPSGDRKVARLLRRAFREGGHDVLLASTLRSWDRHGDASRQQRLRSIGERQAARLIERFGHLDSQERPAAWFTYHLYHKAPDWIGPLVSQALSIPYVVAECSYAPKQAGGAWAQGHESAACAICHADAVIALNEQDIPQVEKLRGSARDIVRMKPFLDVHACQANTDRRAARSELARKHDLDANTPWLLVVAMLRAGDKLASFEVLADALRHIDDSGWQLVIVGDGEARQAIERNFSFASNRILFTGKLDQPVIRDWCNAADLFVWPAINEAFGMALLEAQAGGLPAVAGDAGGVSGIVEHGVTGLLSPEGDSEKLAADVKVLLGDEVLRRRMGAAAADKALREHDIAGAGRLLDAVLAGVTVSR